MSQRLTDIRDETKKRKDVYPNLDDLQTLGDPNLDDRVTLKKIFNNPDDYNIADINTEPNFKYANEDDEFVYHSDQFSPKWPIQTKLNAPDGFYDIERFNPDKSYKFQNEQKKPSIYDQLKDPSLINPKVDSLSGTCNPLNIPLKVLDIEKDVLDDFTVTLIGRRRSGKSWSARWLMYHLRNRFPCGVVITGTKLNNFWSTYIPDEMVHELSDMNIVIDKVFQRQKFILEHPELGIDPRFFLILDDVLSDKYFVQYSVCLSRCFTDGRHHKIFTLITTQDPRGIPPTLRENTDLAVIFRQFQKGRKEAVCEDFVDYLDDIYVAKKFLWEKTKSLDSEGNVLEEAVGDEDEIPVALAVLQSKTTNNLQEIFKLMISHDPGDFIVGDIDYWKATLEGNWRSVMESMEVFKRRSQTFKPRYSYTKKPKNKHK